VLRLNFRQVSLPNRVSELHTSEDYVLLTLQHGKRLVINDKTGSESVLRPTPGCGVQDMADPWVLFGPCAPPRLYNLDTGAWVPVKGALRTAYLESSVILGSHWLWVQMPENCGTGGPQNCHLPAFFSIPSGAENDWQPQGNVYGNVNSPTLKQSLCWPMDQQYRSGILGPFSSNEAPDLSTLTWGDKFIVNLSAASNQSSSTWELQGCGGKPTIPMFSFSNGPAWLMEANAHALTWWIGGATVHGIFIPSLRRFRTQLPFRLSRQVRSRTPTPLRLTANHMWVLDASGHLWDATLPTGP
jgi:hypothetical protein